MNSVSGIHSSFAGSQYQNIEQAKSIRFENALAAARTAEGQAEVQPQDVHHGKAVDFATMLPSKNQHVVPETKVIQSLNKLVQNHPSQNFGSLDIRQ